jgi:hypothetical protein
VPAEVSSLIKCKGTCTLIFSSIIMRKKSI